MKKKIAYLWIDALESDAYEQTRGQLRSSDNGFCCLGVLCNLHAIAHPELAAKETDPSTYLGEGAVLPEIVREWADIKFETGVYTDLKGHGQLLTEDNDQGKDFKQIAEIIRRHWKTL